LLGFLEAVFFRDSISSRTSVPSDARELWIRCTQCQSRDRACDHEYDEEDVIAQREDYDRNESASSAEKISRRNAKKRCVVATLKQCKRAIQFLQFCSTGKNRRTKEKQPARGRLLLG
jgi:hypothetical protein